MKNNILKKENMRIEKPFHNSQQMQENMGKASCFRNYLLQQRSVGV